MIDDSVGLAQKDFRDAVSVFETVVFESVNGQRYELILMLLNDSGSIWISCLTISPFQKFIHFFKNFDLLYDRFVSITVSA